jgi:hypothetical protein
MLIRYFPGILCGFTRDADLKKCGFKREMTVVLIRQCFCRIDLLRVPYLREGGTVLMLCSTLCMLSIIEIVLQPGYSAQTIIIVSVVRETSLGIYVEGELSSCSS